MDISDSRALLSRRSNWGKCQKSEREDKFNGEGDLNKTANKEATEKHESRKSEVKIKVSL